MATLTRVRPYFLAILSLLIAVFYLIVCVCYFVGEEWNDVRLRPAWLIADGLPLYPEAGTGPITTWIYGPATPLLMLPATLATSIDQAFLTAGVLQAMLFAGSFAFACLCWPEPAKHHWPVVARCGALGLSILLLPQYYLVFLIPDSATVAGGLLSLTCLACAQKYQARVWWWLSAVFAATAVFAKWHGVAIPLGELAWLWLSGGRRCAWLHLRRLAVTCAFGVAITLLVSASPAAAWERMVRTMAQLPMLDPARYRERFHIVAPHFGVLLILPGIITWRQFWRRPFMDSPLGLPIFAWLASLPLGLAGIMTIGGFYNSLHGAFFLLPVALIAAAACLQKDRHWAVRYSTSIALIGLLALRVSDCFELPHTLQNKMPKEAVAIAAAGGTHVWLPWRPLATRFASGRHDHDEDGLYILQVTGLYPSRSQIAAHLPPEWNATIFQTPGMNWSVAIAMQAPDWKSTVIGSWLLFGPQGRPSDGRHLPTAASP